MHILTTTTLPTDFTSYLTHYHERAFTDGILTKTDLADVLAELRLAFVKYPDHQDRLVGMARLLTIGIGAKEHLYFKHQEITPEDVQKTLL